MKRALVTGATGFVGNNLVRALNAKGVEVAIFRRLSSSLRNLEGCRYSDFTGEFSSAADLARAADGCDAIFHLAAVVSYTRRDRRERREINVESVRSVIGLLEKNPATRLVHCSSVSAIGVSTSPDVVLDESAEFNGDDIHYSLTKKKGEEIAIEASRKGLDVVVVNPGMILGARGLREVQRQAFLKVAEGKMRVYPPGGNNFASVDDVVDGMIAAFEKGARGERYILGGHNLTYKEYFDQVAAHFGVKGPSIKLPGFLLPPAGGVADILFGKLGWEAGKVAALFGFYSSRKAERELGYRIAPMPKIIENLRGLLHARER